MTRPLVVTHHRQVTEVLHAAARWVLRQRNAESLRQRRYVTKPSVAPAVAGATLGIGRFAVSTLKGNAVKDNFYAAVDSISLYSLSFRLCSAVAFLIFGLPEDGLSLIRGL